MAAEMHSDEQHAALRSADTLAFCGCQAQALAAAAVERLGDFNRRTLDVIASRIYFYLSLAHERTGTLADIRRSVRVPVQYDWCTVI